MESAVANPNGAKSRVAENGVVEYLARNGWPYCERRRLTGAKDKGDVSGTPGICWEVKYGGLAGVKWWAWMRQALVERTNACAEVEVLAVKPPGVGITRSGQWYAALSVPTWDRLWLKLRVNGMRHHVDT